MKEKGCRSSLSRKWLQWYLEASGGRRVRHMKEILYAVFDGISGVCGDHFHENTKPRAKQISCKILTLHIPPGLFFDIL